MICKHDFGRCQCGGRRAATERRRAANNKAREWLVEVLRPYPDALINGRSRADWNRIRTPSSIRIQHNNHSLWVQLHTFTFTCVQGCAMSFCLEGVPSQYRQSHCKPLRRIPTTDRLIAAFYTAITTGGCNQQSKCRSGAGDCKRHRIAAEIREFLYRAKTPHYQRKERLANGGKRLQRLRRARSH
jgi:hypothetical protein